MRRDVGAFSCDLFNADNCDGESRGAWHLGLRHFAGEGDCYGQQHGLGQVSRPGQITHRLFKIFLEYTLWPPCCFWKQFLKNDSNFLPACCDLPATQERGLGFTEELETRSPSLYKLQNNYWLLLLNFWLVRTSLIVSLTILSTLCPHFSVWNFTGSWCLWHFVLLCQVIISSWILCKWSGWGSLLTLTSRERAQTGSSLAWQSALPHDCDLGLTPFYSPLVEALGTSPTLLTQCQECDYLKGHFLTTGRQLYHSCVKGLNHRSHTRVREWRWTEVFGSDFSLL